LERSGGSNEFPAEDRRLKQLKFLIEDGLQKEKSLKASRWVLQILKRIYLAELAAKYEAEKYVSNEPGRPSAKERFTDLLFPHTIKYKPKEGKQGKEGKKGRKGKRARKKRARKVSDQKGQQVSGEEVRESSKKTLEYWLRLGKPLWRMSQCYGLGILVVLPKVVTEKT
jgi:hypothetical protein